MKRTVTIPLFFALSSAGGYVGGTQVRTKAKPSASSFSVGPGFGAADSVASSGLMNKVAASSTESCRGLGI